MSLIPRELYGDDKLMCNGLKCIFSNIFKKTLKQDDENSHTVCAIQCRIAINVVDLVEFYGRLCLLFYWISFTVQLERTLES